MILLICLLYECMLYSLVFVYWWHDYYWWWLWWHSVIKTSIDLLFSYEWFGPLLSWNWDSCFSKHHILSQSKYIINLFHRAHLIDNKTVDTLLEMNVTYSPSDDLPLEDPGLYRTIMGSLVYFNGTRLDIAHDVSLVSLSFFVLNIMFFFVFSNTFEWLIFRVFCVLLAHL